MLLSSASNWFLRVTKTNSWSDFRMWDKKINIFVQSSVCKSIQDTHCGHTHTHTHTHTHPSIHECVRNVVASLLNATPRQTDQHHDNGCFDRTLLQICDLHSQFPQCESVCVCVCVCVFVWISVWWNVMPLLSSAQLCVCDVCCILYESVCVCVCVFEEVVRGEKLEGTKFRF